MSLDGLCFSHPPSLVCLCLGFFFSRRLAVPRLAVSHTGRHPENWLSGTPTVQCTVQTAETSEVVASFADAFTSVSVLAEPALPGDVTAAEGPAHCAAKLLLCVSSFCGSTISISGLVVEHIVAIDVAQVRCVFPFEDTEIWIRVWPIFPISTRFWIRLGDDFWCTLQCSTVDSCTSVGPGGLNIFHIFYIKIDSGS